MSDLAFCNRYLELGEGFYQPCEPTPVAKPSLIKFNDELAADLNLAIRTEGDEYLAELFSGNRVDESSRPVAMAYAGHQFGHFNPHLGDGRALYLGELQHTDGTYRDIQLKGSGRTQFSRNGDGRSALGPVLREYLISEAMYKLGVPTTRALAAVLSGEQVVREGYKPGAVMTRVASSFIRVGSFQYFAMQQDTESIKTLADYVIERNYSELVEAENPYLSLFEAIALRQATLIAQWMQLGFIHGVMNTDNMSVAGETIDYGPCAFMDFFKHDQVYSSIDQHGRYAFANQANIGFWNLSRLAECLLPLFTEDQDKAIEYAQSILDKYIIHFNNEWLNGFMGKLGINTVEPSNRQEDTQFVESLLDCMEENKADFTLTFYHLSRLGKVMDEKDEMLRSLFDESKTIDKWLSLWRERLVSENSDDSERQSRMQKINPVYIPRNHQVEAVIRAAEDTNDFEPFHALYDVLQKPYQYQQGKEDYMQSPEPYEVVHQTFCGT